MARSSKSATNPRASVLPEFDPSAVAASHLIVVRARSRTEALGLIGLFTLALILLLWRLDAAPPFWFDEGYKANAARTLVERGIYATYTTRGYIPFDPGISIGPADIAGIAASYRLFGTGVISSRLPAVAFSLFGLLCLYALMRDMRGWRASLFICLFLIAAPPIQGISFILLGRQALGEATALAFIALSLVLIRRGWAAGRWTMLALAGVACGIGILSRQQWGLALGPALLAVTVLRSLRLRERSWLNAVPLIALAWAILAWKAIEIVAMPPDVRAENGMMALDAMRTNLVTGLWGRTLAPSALATSAVMVLGAGIALWRGRACFQRNTELSDKANEWIDLTLGLLIAFTLVWFALLSVGWPRYAYAGLMMAWLFIGGALWDVARAVHIRLAVSMPRAAALLPGVAITALVLLLVTGAVPQLVRDASTSPQQTGEFIRTNIPHDAVIETWEWELDALSGHWQYHHPHQRYLFEAIRQFSHEQRPFDLRYDVLQANPDYLVTGPFSDWTRLYDPVEVKAYFELIAQFGPYRIYQRQRA